MGSRVLDPLDLEESQLRQKRDKENNLKYDLPGACLKCNSIVSMAAGGARQARGN